MIQVIGIKVDWETVRELSGFEFEETESETERANEKYEFEVGLNCNLVKVNGENNLDNIRYFCLNHDVNPTENRLDKSKNDDEWVIGIIVSSFSFTKHSRNSIFCGLIEEKENGDDKEEYEIEFDKLYDLRDKMEGWVYNEKKILDKHIPIKMYTVTDDCGCC